MAESWYIGTAATHLVSIFRDIESTFWDQAHIDFSWNSSVFATLEANQYDMFVVPSDFSTTDFNCDLPAGCDNAESLWAKSKTESLDHLDNAECIKTYSSNFLAGRRNLLLITSNATRGWQETATTQAVTNDSTVYGIIMSRHYEISLGDSSWTPTAWWCDASSKTNSTGGVTSNVSGVPSSMELHFLCAGGKQLL